MTRELSERRLAENEVLFRQQNEQIAQFVKEQGDELGTAMPKLHFYCECSFEKCQKRLIFTAERFGKLHRNKSQFVVIPGHMYPEYERVVKHTSKYDVVEKFSEPPEKATALHKVPPPILS